MTRFTAATLVWGALTLGACSSEPLRPPGSSRDATVDTFTSSDSLGAERCTGSLDDLGTQCPASFDGTVADLPACWGVEQTVKVCGDVLALGQGGGFGGTTCYYDAATHVLVGALETNDYPAFCSGSSSARLDGQGPAPSCDTTAFSFRRDCSRDGGAG